jgi:nucleotide-binding universal stress UspA family protein
MFDETKPCCADPEKVDTMNEVTRGGSAGSSSAPHSSERHRPLTGLSDLIVHLDGTSEDEVRIAHGEAIAAMCDAHLSGVYTNLLPDYGMIVPGDAGAAAASAMLEVEERIRREGAETFERLRERFSRLGVTNELRRIDASPGAMPGSLAAEARWSDLLVASCLYRSDAPAGWDEVVETVLFESGHGVYFVPPATHPRERLSRVLIAWSDTREAARAVAEALPFLRSASEAEIVVVEGRAQKPATRGLEAVDVAAHLDRQGVKVGIRAVDHGKRSISDVLLEEAERRSADFIVMGAYGHSRWREWIIGGTTREMLANTKVPILAAH